MKQRICILTFLLSTTFSFGQVVSRLYNESAENFVSRVKPAGAEITHKVIETTWNSTTSIIAFYNQLNKRTEQEGPEQQNISRIIATIFLSVDSNKYSRFLIDTFDTEGGDPVIESVFFANADRDAEKELIIIASWEQQHYDVNGTLYGTFVFDNKQDNSKMKLNFMKSISDKLDGGCECSWRDEKTEKAKFKTAGEIKEELTRLGYKQKNN